MRIKFDGASDISVCYPNGMLDTQHSNKKVKEITLYDYGIIFIEYEDRETLVTDLKNVQFTYYSKEG